MEIFQEIWMRDMFSWDIHDIWLIYHSLKVVFQGLVNYLELGESPPCFLCPLAPSVKVYSNIGLMSLMGTSWE